MADGEINFQEGVTSLGKDGFIAHLHAESPMARDVGGLWVASRFEDVRAILIDHARFSSAAMSGNMAAGPSYAFPLLTDDPPRHSVLRALLAKAFTPAAIEAMRPAVETLAAALVAAIPAGEEVDIVAALTTPLPVAVIAGMMGVPEDRRADFKRWSNAVLGIQDSPLEGERVRRLMELQAYFAGLAAERRAAPGDDLVSALTRVRETSEALNDQQVVAFCMLLMIAGNETTTNLLGNLIDRLAGAPQAWAALRADPARIDPAIEESLRVDSPAQMVMRLAREDVEIGGQQVKAGERVLVYLASANRDPGRWSDPADFAPAREGGRHVAFGHGVHTCIGAPLARLEAGAAMHALVARFGSLRRGAGRGRRLPAGLLFGFQSLPVLLD
ncbi:MAG TPA: cytochrome P450 [Caulobacteraceae bacterium]|jgi:cytochrome P450